WLAGVAGLLVARLAGPRAGTVERVARACFMLLVAYIALMTAGSWRARTLAAAWLDEHGVAWEQLVPNPVAANSFAREVIVVRDDRYAFLRVGLLGGDVGVSAPEVARGDDATRVIAAALARQEHAGLRNWLRLPAYEVYREAGGWRVVVRDMRYARLGRRAPGEADIVVSDADVAAIGPGTADVPRP
ncbi:MAG: hypothetical protein JNM38_12225, partial [Acidobacteria bacterium]|nr:hypothetical protein [Acidobacteriota bacterium]